MQVSNPGRSFTCLEPAEPHPIAAGVSAPVWNLGKAGSASRICFNLVAGHFAYGQDRVRDIDQESEKLRTSRFIISLPPSLDVTSQFQNSFGFANSPLRINSWP